MLARLSHRALVEMNKGFMMPNHWPLLPEEKDLVPANHVWMALNTAAYETGVRLLNPRQISSTTWSFRLALSDLDIHQVEYERWVPDRRKGKAPGSSREKSCIAPRYARMNADLTRRVAAVCWHGHRDFMLRFFAQLPAAHIISHLDHWRGQDDFVARHKDSGYKNIGSQMYPCSYIDACIC